MTDLIKKYPGGFRLIKHIRNTLEFKSSVDKWNHQGFHLNECTYNDRLFSGKDV